MVQIPDQHIPKRRWHRWRVVGSAIGLLLLIGAVGLIFSRSQELSGVWSALAKPHPAELATLLVISILLVPLTAVVQNSLLQYTSGVRVSLVEMSSLITLSTLLNMLPLWPGAIGRIGYHHKIHGIHPTRSAMAIIAARLIGLPIAFTALLMVWIFGDLYLSQLAAAWIVVSVLLLLGSLVARWRCAMLAAAAIWISFGLEAIRYRAAFALLGVPLGASAMTAITGGSTVATSIPFLGGGPGAREWAVGWMTAQYEHLPAALEVGLLADLLVRVATLAVMLPCAVLAYQILRQQIQRRPRQS